MTSHYIGNIIKPLAEIIYLSSIVILDSIGHTTEPTGKGSTNSFEFGISVISFCFSIFNDFTALGLMALVDKEADYIFDERGAFGSTSSGREPGIVSPRSFLGIVWWLGV